MDFVIWVCRVMHVISAIVWLGGLIFINAVMNPVVEYEKVTRNGVPMAIYKRFFGFIWMSLWTLLGTGILLMITSPQFRWFDFSTPWTKLLAIKELSFLLMAFFAWQSKKVFQQMERSAERSEDSYEGWRLAYLKLARRTIGVGIIAILATAAMVVYLNPY